MAKILVVDDSTFIRKTVIKQVRSLGHDILEAADGREALGLARHCHDLDVVILDLIMPEMNGFQLMEALHNRDIHVPTIVLTADIQTDTCNQCKQLGAVAVLNKPPKEDELLQALQQALSPEEVKL